jgi:SAM-dependent methyltransferase
MHPDADIGVDISPDSDADILCDITAEQLPLEDDSLKRIYAHDVIEHVRWDVIDVFTEIYRVLEPGGVFDVRVPGRFADPPSKNPLHNGAFHPEWFYSWDPMKEAHRKWDNFKCLPFHVTQTDIVRPGPNPRALVSRLIKQKPPYLPWQALKRQFELQKVTHCDRHSNN